MPSAEKWITLDSSSFSASGRIAIPFDRLPVRSGEGLAYLAEIAIDVNVSDLDTGASAVTVRQLHDLISSLRVRSADGIHGPDGLSGFEVAGLMARLGQKLRKLSANGDTGVAGSTSNATRRLRVSFNYEKFGASPEDFCRSVASFRSGGSAIEIGFSALPTDVTALTATVTTQARVVFRRENIAAAPLLCSKYALAGLTNAPIPGSGGALLDCALANAGSFVASDVTAVQLRADGEEILANVDPETIAGEYDFLAKNTPEQEHGNDTPGNATATYGVPAFLPLVVGKGRSVGEAPRAANFSLTLSGNEAAANLTAIVALALPRTPSETLRQFEANAGPGAVAAATDPANVRTKTRSKMALSSGQLAAYIPSKLLGVSVTGD